MYKLNNFLLVSLTAACFCSLLSCSQEEKVTEVIQTDKKYFQVNVGNESLSVLPNGENETDSIGSLCFSYKGDTYESKVLFTNNETVILNDQIAQLFEDLKKKENVAIYVNEDGSLNFYNSFEEMNSCRKWNNKMRISTRGENNDCMFIQSFKLRVWKHAKGRKKGGPYVEWVLTNPDKTCSPEPFTIGGSSPQLTPIGQNPSYPIQPKVYNDNLWKYNMNNEISSCQMWATIAEGGKVPHLGLTSGQHNHAIITFYDNDDCTGKSITFSEVSVKNTYTQRDYFSGLGFNDLTSSIKISFDNNID